MDIRGVVRLLLVFSLVITAGCEKRPTPAQELMRAIYTGDQSRAIKAVRAQPELAKSKLVSKSTALHLAAMKNMAELIQVLVDLGSSFSEKDGMYETPLHTAAQFGNVEAIKALLRAGADINASSWDGRSEDSKVMAVTPLGSAVRRYELEAAKVLVKNGASLTVPNGVTPILHNACMRTDLPTTPEGARKLVSLWQEWGGDLEVVGPTGDTALDYAKKFDCKPMIDALEAVHPEAN